MADLGQDARISAAESRLAALEAQVTILSARGDRTEGRVDGLTERVVTTEERVRHLPTKELIVSIVLGTIGAIILIISFQEKIREILKEIIS